MKTFRNILIVKPGAVGDLLQLTPVVRALKRKFPRANISILIGSAAAAAMFANNPYLHQAVVFDKRGEHRSLAGFLALWLRLHRQSYDLVVNFQRSNIRTWLLVLAAFPCRVLVYHKAKGRVVHAVVNHLETLTPLGIATDDLDLEIFPGDAEETFADRMFADAGLQGRTVIALNPGASHPVNRWSTLQFALLADMLTERLGVRTIIIGGPGDEPLAAEIIAQASTMPLDLTGKTTLLQLGAVLKRCAALVSGDTGPMHLATAVGTRVLALFGAADPQRTGPIGREHVVMCSGVDCVPCRSRTCISENALECMKRISAEEVFKELSAMVKDRKAVRRQI